MAEFRGREKPIGSVRKDSVKKEGRTRGDIKREGFTVFSAAGRCCRWMKSRRGQKKGVGRGRKVPPNPGNAEHGLLKIGGGERRGGSGAGQKRSKYLSPPRLVLKWSDNSRGGEELDR